MNRSVVVALLLIAIVAGGGYWWWSQSSDSSVPDEVDTAVDYRDPTQEGEDARQSEPPKYPVGDVDAEGDAATADGEAEAAGEDERAASAPLPAMAESDDEVRERITALTGEVPIEGRLVPERLIQKFVVWVNSLDGQMVPVTKWPLRHVPGRPEVEPRGDGRFEWQPANAERYQPYVDAFTTPSVEAMVDTYLRYYPLLQQAFAGLGEEEDYFNDRVIAIIDHLLQAPPARSSYLLVQPEVLYEFADPDLEALSSGQKILLRLGPEQSAAVRDTLRAIRAEILSRTAPEAQEDAAG